MKNKKTVLILAATSDIGKHIAFGFAERGWDLYITGKDPIALNQVTSILENKYAAYVQEFILDITDYPSHRGFLDSLPELPDTVVCCFGYYKDQEKALSDFQEAYLTMSVNYVGAVSFLNLVSDKFQKRGYGSIGVISSVAGERGRQMNFLYGSAKAGLTVYLSGLRNRLFKSNVSVTTILLGPVYTRMSEGHNLMPVLTAKPEQAAEEIIHAVIKKKDNVYILWYWRFIMMIIRSVPEFIFKRLGKF
ncbi:MAG TPA: SDR family oxidoreductase [Leptospiraceae bacterium]|nr:SDR family oxidoreductase [Leptospiraceae bacterium]HNO23710.1 SDR family oxidoreductase [Leptospiraceae bacterium]